MNDDRELIQKCKQQVANPTNIMEKFRAKMILRYGCSAMKTIGKMFLNMDDDGNKKLSKEELYYGLRDRGIEMNEDEINELFSKFDRDQDGSVNLNEFLIRTKGPMKERRMILVERAFCIMDSSNDGVITVDDMKTRYNAKHHPKYISGEWTQEKCLGQYLKAFDSQSHPDGKVTKTEWEDYYFGVSASVDDDAYFDLMMRQAWGLNEKNEIVTTPVKKGWSNQN